MAFPGLFLFIFVFQNSWQKTVNIDFASDWIRTADPWWSKPTALQLGHNHRPRLMLRVIKNGLNRYKTSCLHTIWFTLFKWLPRCLSTPFIVAFEKNFASGVSEIFVRPSEKSFWLLQMLLTYVILDEIIFHCLSIFCQFWFLPRWLLT